MTSVYWELQSYIKFVTKNTITVNYVTIKGYLKVNNLIYDLNKKTSLMLPKERFTTKTTPYLGLVVQVVFYPKKTYI